MVLAGDALVGPRTGIGTYAFHLARGLLANPEVDLKVFAHWKLLTNRQVEAFVGDASGAGGGAIGRATGRIRPVLASSSYAVRLYELAVRGAARYSLAKLGQDHVFHSPNFGAIRFPGRSAVTFHDLSVQRFPEFHPPARVRLVQKAMEAAVRDGAHIITDTEHVRREVIAHFAVGEERCSVVPLGADPCYAPRSAAACRPLLNTHGLEYGGYFLFVSTIEPRKNILRMLDAYRIAKSREPALPPLAVAGHPGWQSGREHEALRTMQDRGLVRYLGFVPGNELPILVSGALAMLFPSLYEGFGLPALEGMQSGVPVVTSLGSAMEEVTGGAALLVNPLDPGSIAQGLLRVASDPPLRARLAGEGLRRAAAFSWQHCVQGTLQAYKSIR